MKILLALLFLFLSFNTFAQQPEATSLTGKPLYPPELSPETKAEYEKNLEIAKKEYEQSPDNADAMIWLGRRTAYLGAFNEAIEIFHVVLKSILAMRDF